MFKFLVPHCDIYISTPPYQVVDYMIPFYPDPFGLFVNMEVDSIETPKKEEQIDVMTFKNLEYRVHLMVGHLRLLHPGQHSSCPFSRSPGILFIQYRFSWQTHAISKGRTKEISYWPIRTRNIITRSSHWSLWGPDRAFCLVKLKDKSFNLVPDEFAIGVFTDHRDFILIYPVVSP